MKIHKLHIDAFGKLSDFDMEFSDGLNCIYRENEFGKSTVLAFIRAMFYGFPKNLKRNNTRDFSRHKYTPWGQKSCGGRLIFSNEGMTYLLERIFMDRKPDDRLVLTEAETGRKIDWGTEEIGEFLFGLSEAEFVNTIFIGQMSSDFAMTGRETQDLSQRLANLAATGSDVYSFEVAEKNIKAAIAHLQNTQKRGRIPQIISRVDKLEQEEERIEQMSARIDQYNDEIKQLSSHIVTMNDAKNRGLEERRLKIEERDQALQTLYNQTERAIIEAQEKQKSQVSLQEADKDRLHTLLKSVDEEISINDKDKEQLQWAARQRIDEMQKEYENIQKQGEMIQNDIKTIESKLEEKTYEIEYLRAQKKAMAEKGLRTISNNRNIFFLAAMVLSILMVLGLAMYLPTHNEYFFIFGLLGLPAVALWIGFARVYAKAKKTLTHKKEQIEEQIELARDEMGRLSNENNQKHTDYSRRQLMLDHQNRMVLEEESRLAQSLSRLDMRSDALNRQRDNFAEKISHNDNPIRDDVEGTSRAVEKSKLDILLEKKKSIQDQMKTIDAEKAQLAKEEKESADQVSELKQEIAKRQGQIEQLISNMPVQSEIEDQKASSLEQLALCTQYFDALGVASEAMKEAAREMERVFAPQVSARGAEYLKRLTSGKYSTIRMDKDFKIEVDVRDALDYQNASYFSGATTDQIYLALRLSISDLIMPDQNTLPFFLDDALNQYDEMRLKDAVQLICDISLSRQVLLFTCHAHVDNMIKDCLPAHA